MVGIIVKKSQATNLYQIFLPRLFKLTTPIQNAYSNIAIYIICNYCATVLLEYTDFDKLLTLQDLVRKAKYLQEIGKIDESLKYLDELIKSTLRVANGRLTCAEALGHKEFVMTKLYRSA